MKNKNAQTKAPDYFADEPRKDYSGAQVYGNFQRDILGVLVYLKRVFIYFTMPI